MESGERSQSDFFATTTAPECEIKGLFYGGGFKQLGIQLVGIIAVIAWTAVTMTIVICSD